MYVVVVVVVVVVIVIVVVLLVFCHPVGLRIHCKLLQESSRKSLFRTVNFHLAPTRNN